jgi:hypothetical protein
MHKIKEVLHLSKDEKHGKTSAGTHSHLQGAEAHQKAGVVEGKAGAGHAKAGLGEQVSKNVAETKEKLHIGNKHGEATAAKEHHKQNEDVHKAKAAGHAESVVDHTQAGIAHVDKARSHDKAQGNIGHRAGVPNNASKVIDKKYYTTIEDRPIDQEQVDRHREHNLYEKDFKQEVNATGRERQIGSNTEVVGAAEHIIGQNHMEGDVSRLIEANLPKGALSERPGGDGWVQGKKGPVCESTEFAVTGDRTVDKEHVTALKEHREFEKEFEINTKFEGEKALGRTKEGLGSERTIIAEKTTTPCDGHPTLGGKTGKM